MISNFTREGEERRERWGGESGGKERRKEEKRGRGRGDSGGKRDERKKTEKGREGIAR